MSGEDDERVYEKIFLEEARMEFLKDNPVLKFFNGVIFLSRSNGKNKKRKYGCWIILLKMKHEKKGFF